MNRPVVWAAVAFAAGIWASGQPDHALRWIGGLGAMLAVAWFLPKYVPYRDGIPILMVFLFAGAAVDSLHRPERHGDTLSNHNRKHPESIYVLEGKVSDAPLFTSGMEYMPLRLEVDHVQLADKAVALRGGVVVRWSDPQRPLHPGERIRVRGRLDPVLGETNIGMGSAEDYYRRLGYHSVLRIRGDAVSWLSRPTVNLRYWASRLRQWQSDMFAQTAPDDILSFLRAVWLGDRATYSDEEYAPFVKTGTAHMLSVSGVHVGIVYLSLQLLLRSLVKERKRRTLFVLGVIVLFALVTGARPPILRATLMIGLYVWAELLDRESDSATALSLAALCFLVVNPALLRDTAFVLSFGSLASILIFSEAISLRMTSIPLALRQSLATTVGVSILPLPLGAHFFHTIPLIGPLCNLLVIPLLTGVLWLCMFLVITAPFSLPVASLFGHAAAPLIYAINGIATRFSQIPGTFVTVTSPTLLAGVLYLLAALGAARVLAGGAGTRRWIALSTTALALSWVFWRPMLPPASIDVLDVGHGDAIFVRSPGGSTMLVDAGNQTEYVDMGKRVVVPWLLANGIDRLDRIVVTHADRDHIGGVASVLDRIRVGEVVLSPHVSGTELETNLIERCREKEIPLRRVKAGDTLPLHGAAVTVLHPEVDYTTARINNQSLVLHVVWPGLSTLLSGDIEVEAEARLLASLPHVDLLKVPHHGSHTSSGVPFLDTVAPRIAIVSTRASNLREAVGREVMPRYVARGIAVYRTDYLGGIQIRQRGGQIVVRSARRLRGYSLDPSDN